MGNKTGKSLHPDTVQQLVIDLKSEFTDEEIRDWYSEYTSSLKKGEKGLSRAAFIAVYNKLFSGDATKFAEQVFRVFDNNGNDVVDFQEFMTGLYMSSSTETTVKCDWAFKMYDLDGDGFISKSEMTYILECVCKMAQCVLPDEYKTPKDLTNMIFSQLDKNNDNKISLKEFQEGVGKVKVVVDILELDPAPHDEVGDGENNGNTIEIN